MSSQCVEKVSKSTGDTGPQWAEGMRRKPRFCWFWAMMGSSGHPPKPAKSPSFRYISSQSPEPPYGSGLCRFRVFALAYRKWSNALEAPLTALQSASWRTFLQSACWRQLRQFWRAARRSAWEIP